jgi:hypothetical protein
VNRLYVFAPASPELADRVGVADLAECDSRIARPGQRRGVRKTDALDAVRIARSVLAVDITRLRRPRADGQRVALRVSTVAREETVTDRTRATNA